MEIAEQQIGGVLVLRPTGRLDGPNAPGFEKTVLDRLESRPTRVVLDLAGIEYISSAGLRTILLAAKRAKAVGCGLAACGLREHIREVFDLSGFGNIVTIRSTLEEALKS
jgi:anti-anti-sigma factor